MPVEEEDGANSVAEKTRPNICHWCMKKDAIGQGLLYCARCKIAVYCSKTRHVCVCVKEGGRERERERESLCLCVCVCVSRIVIRHYSVMPEMLSHSDTLVSSWIQVSNSKAVGKQ